MYYIYKITNLINGKTYIGQRKYKKLNDSYMGSGKHLIAAQRKYGIENFKKEILVFNVTKKEHIDLLEKQFIKYYRELGKAEYNIADGGQGCCIKHSEETKRKMSESRKGIKNGFYGKTHSEEVRQKISAANKRRIISDETRRKLSTSHKGKPSPTKGKKLTDEHKRKLSKAAKIYWAKKRGK